MSIKTGVLGGTFNPPHIGHLSAAEHARQALGLDKVLFIPTNIPPHKVLPACSATTEQRCEMVRRMISPYPWAYFSDIEVSRGGPSYTVDTLRQLHRMGYEDLTLIVGTDMLLSFDQVWRAPREIARLAALAVVSRGIGDRRDLARKAKSLHDALGARIRLIDCPVVEVSSTELRRGGAFDRLTPPAVAAYIAENRLYQQV